MENGSKLLINTSILYRSMQKFYDKRLSKYDIGSGQLPLLLLIYEHEGISMQELAKMGAFDKGTITRGLVKLEEQGYIRIETNPKDKRIRQLYTCEKTKDIISAAYLIRREWWEQVTSELRPEEIEEFERIQEQIAENARDGNREEDSHTRIFGMQKLTLLDYPGKLACTLFTGGCNFRCPYCQNSDLVFLNENLCEIDRDDITDYLKRRKKVLEGVCISGGEPLLQANIAELLSRIKSHGYVVKLDTNGSQPERLAKLVSAGLIDYVAMDVKNALPRYGGTIGLTSFDPAPIEASVAYLKQGHIPYEFRTTIVKEFHTKADMETLARWLKGGSVLYLQQFVASERTIAPDLHAYGETEMQELAEIANQYLPARIRGIG